MERVSEIEKQQSLEALRSAIRKSERGMARMSAKGANTTLIARRLKALRIGLAMLEQLWHQETHAYTQEERAEARDVLMGLFPSMENIYAKSEVGSPQRTLLERRMRALRLAVAAMKGE